MAITSRGDGFASTQQARRLLAEIVMAGGATRPSSHRRDRGKPATCRMRHEAMAHSPAATAAWHRSWPVLVSWRNGRARCRRLRRHRQHHRNHQRRVRGTSADARLKYHNLAMSIGASSVRAENQRRGLARMISNEAVLIMPDVMSP